MLGLLTGDGEGEPVRGSINGGNARRLWALFPHAARALVDRGPDLIDTFVSGAVLHARATATPDEPAEWTVGLEALVQQREQSLTEGASQPEHAQPNQEQVFEQFAGVLEVLAQQRPLLLVVKDMHWADDASTRLLSYLVRRLRRCRVLLVGIYRPTVSGSSQRRGN